MRVLRFEIPVDDRWHEISLSGDVASVSSRTSGVVEFWALDNDAPPVTRSFRVYGTGCPIEVPIGGVELCGTTLDALSPLLVWHLIENV